MSAVKNSAVEQAIKKINHEKISGSSSVRPRKPLRNRIITKEPTERVRPISARKSVNKKASQFRLPYKALEAEGMVEPGGTRNQLSEEYRAIKRPILAAIENATENDLQHGNIIMVTSSVSGEGKTFSAINLAISIALERDRTVLLVDGDITNPSAGQRLGFRRTTPGLTDVLLDDHMDIKDVIYQSDIENLCFLPAGSAPKHVTELLSSRDMRKMIDNLSNNYKDQVIVFDSAPMLMTSEASVVADLAGQIVFVVGAETTTQGMVSDSLKMINDHRRVGFLLNKTRKKQSNIYGYGYGYGYGYDR